MILPQKKELHSLPHRANLMSNGQPKQQTMKQQEERHVQFSKTEQVKMVEAVENDEKSSVWYTRQDLLLANNLRSEDCSCQQRPLDTHAPKCICQLPADGERQRDFVMGLLQQQLEHKKFGIQDPKGLFQLSRACSKPSRLRALQEGRRREKEVQQLTQEERTTLVQQDPKGMFQLSRACSRVPSRLPRALQEGRGCEKEVHQITQERTTLDVIDDVLDALAQLGSHKTISCGLNLLSQTTVV
jgi:hypothetical protein